jgi:retinol dehydrogenase-12
MGASFSSFLNQSFRIPPPILTEKNLPNQQGKVFIVTGSNTGVGKELASILYKHDATVYIAARTESKAQTAISDLQSLHPSSKGTLHFLHLNLSDLSTIKASADAFKAKESRLDVLWNNAGVMVPPKGSAGAQGHDLQYVTNILGPFLFTKLLLPTLRATAVTSPKSSVRVCWAGSLAVDLSSPTGGCEFDAEGTLIDYNKSSASKAYGVTKAANYQLGYEFGKRFGNADGVLHDSFNPGNLQTELQRHAAEAYGKFAMRILDGLLYPAVFGAYTELYSGLSADLSVEGDQGVFVKPWGRKGIVRTDVAAECREGGKSEMLWKWCEAETAKYA